MRKLAIITYAVIFIASKTLSQGSNASISGIPIDHHFTTEDYQGGIQNWDIALSNTGYIYVANNSGLLEFDGNKWNTYSFASNTRMICVNASDPDRVFVGGQNVLGYFSRNQFGMLDYHSLLDEIEDSTAVVEVVWSIIKHREKYFFNTDHYTFVYDGKTLKSIPFDKDGGYMFQVRDSLISYSKAEGLIGWNGQRFTTNSISGFFKEKSVMSVLPIEKTTSLVFLSNGDIYSVSDNKIRNWQSSAQELLSKNLINTAILLKNGNIGIGTQNDGIIIVDQEGRLINHFTKGRGLNGRSVHGILEDDFNNLWIGQNNGISYLETGAPFRFINETLGVWGTGYAAAHHENTLYLGTNNGLFNKKITSSSMIDEYQLIPGTEGQVWSIDAHNNQVYMGHHRGAYLIQFNRATSIFDQNGVWKFENIPGTNQLIAGWYNGFLISDKLGDFRPLKGFSESSRIFEFENDSTIWMTHGFKGAYKLTKTADSLQFSFYGNKKGFPSNILINVFKLGNELIFPAEYGIYQYQDYDDLFKPSEQLENLLGHNSHISVMEMTPGGDIYYISNEKMGLLRRTAFNTYENIQSPFNTINKYLSDDLENITFINDENILIGAKEGFVNYNPKHSTRSAKDFNTYIRSINLVIKEDSLVRFGQIDTSLPLGNIQYPLTSIRFEFSSPYFDGFKDLKYQYKLDNFDKDWSEWSSTHIKEYTSLPVGTYIFRARAKNIYDEISTEAELVFRIAAPWYRTNYAYIGYLLLLFMLFGIAMVSLDHKHKNDKRRMEILQQREMHQKDLELKDVSQTSAAAINALKNENLQAEINHKNKELASSAMHLLNKNEFMVGIKTKLANLAKSDKISTEELKKIIKNIDKNISDDKDWDQFSTHFDQVHGDFLRHLKDQYPDLSPQETKLAAYLRMNMTSKEIAQLLNISVRGVEIGRYRLRKKLKIDRDTNLVSFMMEL